MGVPQVVRSRASWLPLLPAAGLGSEPSPKSDSFTEPSAHRGQVCGWWVGWGGEGWMDAVGAIWS